MKTPILLPAALAAMFVLAGCAVNPVTGRSELAWVGESTEIAIGQEQYLPSQQSQGGTYKVDPELSSYVSEVGRRLAAVSDRGLPYEFVVLNNGVPNAWALPGGKIAVNRGLLTELDNEAELAAVLGHEIVHSAARHGAKAMERGTLLQGVLLATAIATSDNEASNYIVGGAQVGAQLLTTANGRGAELEADQYGIRYMANAGYDPHAAITLQEKFVVLAGNRESSWLDGLFATHPPSEERVRRNVETVAALPPAQQQGELGADRYRQRLAYLESRDKAYRAFSQAEKLAASGKLKEAGEQLDYAIAQEPREARFVGLKADLALAGKSFDEAKRLYDRALTLDDGYYEYYLGRGLVNSRLGNRQAARLDLERSNQLLPTAIAMNELGQLSLAAGNRSEAKGYFQNAMGGGGNVGSAARAAYIRLDLPERPGAYIETRPTVTGGQLQAQVRNATEIAVRRATVTFTARINGETWRRSVLIDNIPPGGAGTVASGIPVREGDQVDGVNVAVTGAEL